MPKLGRIVDVMWIVFLLCYDELYTLSNPFNTLSPIWATAWVRGLWQCHFLLSQLNIRVPRLWEKVSLRPSFLFSRFHPFASLPERIFLDPPLRSDGFSTLLKSPAMNHLQFLSMLLASSCHSSMCFVSLWGVYTTITPNRPTRGCSKCA